MVHRGANDRKPKGEVHTVFKVKEFEGDKPLIVVEADDQVELSLYCPEEEEDEKEFYAVGGNAGLLINRACGLIELCAASMTKTFEDLSEGFSHNRFQKDAEEDFNHATKQAYIAFLQVIVAATFKQKSILLFTQNLCQKLIIFDYPLLFLTKLNIFEYWEYILKV